MKLKRTPALLLIVSLVLVLGCRQNTGQNVETNLVSPTSAEEKEAILAALNEETASAFARNYEGWQDKWVHSAFVTKTYIDFPENAFTETRGWEEVDAFVREFFEEHPEPEPAPEPLSEIQVRLYGDGAWVSYEAADSLRGLKRETRLMEKIDGKWKIAGMHTTIYGFDEPGQRQ